ncbi:MULTISPECIES: CpsD/CapB family tyrosine-protein kinase [Aeribacillus]|jgi:protein-tyrosine kinase|uniref:non-specific protein-tyrosine kinase n=1 Tax=Aeribacillus pallidus TaxID=33936 RepID=A0A165WR08_9BACI|nr:MULTISPECIES: CpsD/CapB family tyrosine-protein kinase [Aeribacillus]KZN95219.1 capsular biosynthesis protein [Aeribacillus pallidus]MED0704101.1 CpsD/CapB family tyrosine-protein kinase [Aeribacillus composti]REJ22845.1 MAG: capsular biosynthesis protein [Bacillaceae bacterium]BBU41199.1 tyrosine-protein kinase YwqD [Aeribacillus pallidus]
MAPRAKGMKQKQRTLITALNPKSPISEQYRTIRTNIQFSSVDHEIRSIMITSTGPGEGKSTTAANLAVVFAQQGKQVLLIDADLRKPTVHYTFRLQNIHGLTSVLLRNATLQEAVSVSEVDHLDVLTSGPIPPNPAELLSSRSMVELLKEAYDQYDIVIIDSPPLLAVADAQILANQVDASIMVVASGKTEREAALKGKESLIAAQSKLLGVVLNGKPQKDSHYYYYYGGKN